MLNAVLIG